MVYLMIMYLIWIKYLNILIKGTKNKGEDMAASKLICLEDHF